MLTKAQDEQGQTLEIHLESISVIIDIIDCKTILIRKGQHSDFWSENTQLQIEAIRSCGPTQKTLTMLN